MPNIIDMVEAVEEYGSKPHKTVRCEVWLIKVDTWQKEQLISRKLPGASGGHVDDKRDDREEVEHQLPLGSLREEADFWEAVKPDPAIPDEVAKAATTTVRLNLQGEGMLNGNKSKSERGRGPPSVWESQAVKEERRQGYSDTREAQFCQGVFTLIATRDLRAISPVTSSS